MAVNFCSNCGAKIRAGAKFCGSCGQKIYSEEKKLPPMPYEKSKSVMEVYAEKKAAAQVQAESVIKLEKTLPTSQTHPKSVAEIFAEQKKIAQAQVARENLINVYNKAKNPPQATPPPCSGNPPPTPQELPRPTYTPSKPAYREDATIKEKFFSTKSRINSTTYLARSFIAFVGSIPLLVLGLLIGSEGSEGFGMILSFGGFLLFIVSEYCLAVSRLKDTKYEASAESLAVLAVLLAPLSFVIIQCIPSKDG